MKDKYNMSKESNIFFAKRKLIDNIYKSANLEGIAVTFADTVDFLNNVNNGHISVDNMLKLKGLKDAWEYILNTIDNELNIDYIKKIHFEICKGKNIHPLGDFRKSDVGITGTNWRPKLPNEVNYEKELNDIMSNPHKIDRCTNLFCWIQRSQMFLDENKRVANLVTNKEMIKNGQGIISIPVNKIGTYQELLIKYYETGNNKKLKQWLYDNCIDGIK